MFAKADPNILFLGHDASQTGAPRLLLHFLSWLKANSSAKCTVVLGKAGPLESEFRELASTTIVDHESHVLRLCRRLMPRAYVRPLERRFRQRKLATIRCSVDPDIIYANTVAVSDEIMLVGGTAPVLWHIHELPHGIRWYAGEKFQRALGRVNRYVAVSQSVRTGLIKEFGIAETAIETIHEFIEPPTVTDHEAAQNRKALIQELSLPSTCFLVGGCGTTDWRKGPDLFLLVAKYLKQNYPDLPAHLVWIGGGTDDINFSQIQHDIRHLGLSSTVHFIGSKQVPINYLSGFDVFALTSREDPFPLAMLEAASVGLPIVCFEGAGGGGEFVDEDAGRRVPYLDVVQMANEIAALGKKESVRRALGSVASSKVQRMFTTSVQCPKLMRQIQRVCAEKVS